MVYIGKINNLKKSYDGKTFALNNFAYEIPKGKIIGLLGPNGAGKTTLIKILTGLIRKYEGEVTIMGNKIGVESKKLIAYLPDSNFIDDDWTVNYAMEYYKDFFEDFDNNKALTLFAAFGIHPDSVFKTLSKGNKEKVQLILTLSRKALLYIFDEPIAGVDPASREVIFELILKNCGPESTVIISTHLVRDVEDILDEIIFINNGKLIRQGDVKSLKEETGKSIDDLFKEDFKCSVSF